MSYKRPWRSLYNQRGNINKEEVNPVGIWHIWITPLKIHRSDSVIKSVKWGIVEEDNRLNKRRNSFPQTCNKHLKNKQPNVCSYLLIKAARRLIIPFQSAALLEGITWGLIKANDKYNAKSRLLFWMTNSPCFQWSTIFYCHTHLPHFKISKSYYIISMDRDKLFRPEAIPFILINEKQEEGKVTYEF